MSQQNPGAVQGMGANAGPQGQGGGAGGIDIGALLAQMQQGRQQPGAPGGGTGAAGIPPGAGGMAAAQTMGRGGAAMLPPGMAPPQGGVPGQQGQMGPGGAGGAATMLPPGMHFQGGAPGQQGQMPGQAPGGGMPGAPNWMQANTLPSMTGPGVNVAGMYGDRGMDIQKLMAMRQQTPGLGGGQPNGAGAGLLSMLGGGGSIGGPPQLTA